MPAEVSPLARKTAEEILKIPQAKIMNVHTLAIQLCLGFFFFMVPYTHSD